MKNAIMRQMRLIGAVFASLFVTGSFAAYTDGLIWSFSAKQGEADGTFDAAKFVDEVSADTASPLTLTFNYDNVAARPYFTNVTVRSGMQGKSFTRTCLYLPQPTAGTIGTDFRYMLANATVPNAKLAKGEATFFIRFSWDGKFVDMKDFGETYSYNYGVYIFDNARDYGTSKGWDFHLDANSYSAGNPYVLRSQWYPYQETSCWVNYNKTAGADWIDFALTLNNTDTGTKITYYMCPAGKSSISTYSKVLTGSGTIPGPANKAGTLFGLGSTTVAESGGRLDSPKNFRGTVAAVKLWGRALSAEEIDLVFRDAASPLVLNDETLTLTADRKVSTLTMNGACTINGPGKLIVTAPDGITVNGGTATLACPVLFDTGASTVSVTVDATSKLVQTGEWSGSSPIKLVGAGSDYATHSFELRGTNTFTGALSFDRAKVYLYGGASVGTSAGATSWTVSKGANGSLVYFMGGTFVDNFTITGSNNYKGWWRAAFFASNCTNVFTGTLNFGQPSYYVAEKGSRTIFKGTVNGNSDYTPGLESDAEIVFATNSVYSGTAFYPTGSGTVHLHSARTGGTGNKNEYRVESGVTWRLYGENLINGTAGRGGIVNGTIDLNGFDQVAGACRGGEASGVVTSASAATWTVDQSSFADIANANAFTGAVSLRKLGSNDLRLQGVSTTTGSLFVDVGTVTLGSSAAWAGPIEVAAGAAVSFDGDRTLADGDCIRLATGGNIALEGQLFACEGQLLLNDSPVPAGKYTKDSPVAFVSGNGSVIVTAVMGDPIVVESNMTIDDDVLVPSVTFKGPYTISGLGSITVLGGAVTIDDGNDNEDGYVMNVPLTLSGNIVGCGYLTLEKGASFLESTFVTNANLRVNGTLNVAKGLTFVQTPAANNRAELILSNARIEAGTTAIVLATENTYYALRAEEGTTNAVTCGTLSGSGGNSRFFFDQKSLTTFNCAVGGLQYFCPAGTGEAVYNGKVSGWNLSLGGGVMHLAAADNRFAFNGDAAPKYATQVSVAWGARLLLDTANALSDRRNEVNVGGEIVLAANQSVGPLVGDGRITSATGATWDFDQRSFASEAPKVEGPTSNTVVFADSLNVRKSGSHAVYFGGISTSTGELQVAAGTVGFYGKGSWVSCAAVRVAAGARIVLDRRRIGKKTTSVYLEPGAKLQIPDPVNAYCEALYLNGVKQDPGSYTQENCSEYIEGTGTLWAGRSPGMVMVVK